MFSLAESLTTDPPNLLIYLLCLSQKKPISGYDFTYFSGVFLLFAVLYEQI